jgi:hypothetical protein
MGPTLQIVTSGIGPSKQPGKRQPKDKECISPVLAFGPTSPPTEAGAWSGAGEPTPVPREPADVQDHPVNTTAAESTASQAAIRQRTRSPHGRVDLPSSVVVTEPPVEIHGHSVKVEYGERENSKSLKKAAHGTKKKSAAKNEGKVDPDGHLATNTYANLKTETQKEKGPPPRPAPSETAKSATKGSRPDPASITDLASLMRFLMATTDLDAKEEIISTQEHVKHSQLLKSHEGVLLAWCAFVSKKAGENGDKAAAGEGGGEDEHDLMDEDAVVAAGGGGAPATVAKKPKGGAHSPNGFMVFRKIVTMYIKSLGDIVAAENGGAAGKGRGRGWQSRRKKKGTSVSGNVSSVMVGALWRLLDESAQNDFSNQAAISRGWRNRVVALGGPSEIRLSDEDAEGAKDETEADDASSGMPGSLKRKRQDDPESVQAGTTELRSPITSETSSMAKMRRPDEDVGDCSLSFFSLADTSSIFQDLDEYQKSHRIFLDAKHLDEGEPVHRIPTMKGKSGLTKDTP